MQLPIKPGFSYDNYVIVFGHRTRVRILKGQDPEPVYEWNKDEKTGNLSRGEQTDWKIQVYFSSAGALDLKVPVDALDSYRALEDLSEAKLVNPEVYIGKKNTISLRAEGLESANKSDVFEEQSQSQQPEVDEDVE